MLLELALIRASALLSSQFRSTFYGQRAGQLNIPDEKPGLDEVREAILERPYWAAPGREGTILVYGRTYAGRYLLVVAIDENGAAFIVTARDMTDAEKKTFRRKAR